jgi:hypothetical protein
MLELFFDSCGIVHMEFIPEGAIITRSFAIYAIQFMVSILNFGA